MWLLALLTSNPREAVRTCPSHGQVHVDGIERRNTKILGIQEVYEPGLGDKRRGRADQVALIRHLQREDARTQRQQRYTGIIQEQICSRRHARNERRGREGLEPRAALAVLDPEPSQLPVGGRHVDVGACGEPVVLQAFEVEEPASGIRCESIYGYAPSRLHRSLDGFCLGLIDDDHANALRLAAHAQEPQLQDVICRDFIDPPAPIRSPVHFLSVITVRKVKREASSRYPPRHSLHKVLRFLAAERPSNSQQDSGMLVHSNISP